MKKRLITVSCFVLMLFALCFVSANNSTYAKAYTKASVTKKVKKLKNEIKKIEKKYLVQKKSEKDVPAGYKAFWGAKLSIWDDNYYKTYIGNTYYKVKNPEALNGGVTMATGYIKKTGSTEVYYDKGTAHTCYVVVAKKDPHSKSIKMNNKIKKLKKELLLYQNALKQSIYFYNEKEVEICALNEKKQIEICYEYDNKKINSVIWKSSNPNIVTVDSKGKITGVNPGRAKITATTTVSKKKITINVIVYDWKVDSNEANVSFPSSYCYIPISVTPNIFLEPGVDEYDLEQNVRYPFGDDITITAPNGEVNPYYVTYRYIDDDYGNHFLRLEFHNDLYTSDFRVAYKDNTVVIHYIKTTLTEQEYDTDYYDYD